MRKRAADAGASGGRSKRKYFHGSGHHVSDFAPGLRGALITCDVHVEKQAIRETFQILEELTDPAEEEVTSKSTSATTAGDALALELAAMQEKKDGAPQKPSRKFSVAQTGCSGTVFIRFEDKTMDPLQLVDQVMERARTAGRSAAPHVIRMLPVQATVSARTVGSIAEAAEPLINHAMKEYAGTYAVHWRRRFNGDIEKMKVVDALATVVQATAPKATVDLSNAATVSRRTTHPWHTHPLDPIWTTAQRTHISHHVTIDVEMHAGRGDRSHQDNRLLECLASLEGLSAVRPRLHRKHAANFARRKTAEHEIQCKTFVAD